MKRISPFLRRSTAVDLDSAMTPMIDVVFLLLVFFVWTASFVTVEQILPSELSSQIGDQAADVVTPPAEQDLDNVVLRIRMQGDRPTWRINEHDYDAISDVERQLRLLARAAAAAPVILHPQSDVPLGYVVEAWDVTRSSGMQKISFAVNRPGE